jgi:hypothetical protein
MLLIRTARCNLGCASHRYAEVYPESGV